jgi:CheY-like chemotaxis protein
VLVVDDEDIVRVVLATLLRRGGFEVIEAHDGVEALASASAMKPDLVLSDLNMPRCDGERLCLELKRNPLTADIPLVIMTGGPTDEARLRALGCVAVFYKPLPASMADHVRVLLGRARRSA